MNLSKAAFFCALTGLFGLIIVIILWTVWLNPPTDTPVGLILILQLPLLLLPMHGMMHGKPYTFGWATFIALFYFILGVDNAAIEGREFYGSLQIMLSLLMFNGSMLYARLEGRRQRLENEQKETEDQE